MNKYNCNICNDTGWETVRKEGKTYLKRCKCIKIDLLLKKSLSSNIPPRFAGSELEHFYPEKGDTSMKKLKESIKKFIDDYPAVQKGIILHGGTGVGKTRLLCTVASEIIKKIPNINIFYVDWNDIVREMKSGESHSFRDFTMINELIERLTNADLLIVDELGASEPSQWVRDNIYYVINHRYNRQKITLFGTNYLDIKHDGHQTLKERIGDRIRSRIFEMATSYNISGVDYRQKWG